MSDKLIHNFQLSQQSSVSYFIKQNNFYPQASPSTVNGLMVFMVWISCWPLLNLLWYQGIVLKYKFFSIELKQACKWVFIQFYCHHGLIIELSSASENLSDMCLASVSFAHVNESGLSMQMPSVLISALTGCLSFNGLLQILPAHSFSPKHFSPLVPLSPSFGSVH